MFNLPSRLERLRTLQTFVIVVVAAFLATVSLAQAQQARAVVRFSIIKAADVKTRAALAFAAGSLVSVSLKFVTSAPLLSLG